MAVKHAKVVANANTADTTVAQPTDWNANHTIDPGTIGTTELATTGVTPGAYTNANITVLADGRVSVAASGTGGGGITNGAGANIVTKSNGTNLVASSISDDGSTVTVAEHVSVQTSDTDTWIRMNNTSTGGRSFEWDSAGTGSPFGAGLSLIDVTAGAARQTFDSAGGLHHFNGFQADGNVTLGDATHDTATGRDLSVGRNLTIASVRRIPAVSITAASSAIINAEVVVAQMTIPANSLVAGSTFTFEASATTAGASGSTGVIQIRLGPTTLTGPIINSVSRVEVSTGPAFRFWRGTIVIRSIGATGSAIGDLRWEGFDGGGYALTTTSSSVSTPVTINTTSANFLELTANSGSATSSYTFQRATIAQVF